MPGSPLLNIGTALGGLTSGYQQAQQNALRQQLGQIQIANALQQLRQQQQMQQAGPVAWNALQQLGGGQGGQNPYAGLAGIGGGNTGGTQATTPPAPQINIQPPMQQASVPQYTDSSSDNTTPPPSGNLSPTQSAVATLVSQNQPVPADESPTSPGTGYTYDRNTYQWMPPAQPQSTGYAGGQPTGNLAQGGALSLGNVLDTISRDESGGRNIKQTAYSGEGINPSTGTHTAPSSASGLYQITDTTWRGWAPKVGVDLAQYPTAMSAPPAVQRKVAAYGLQSEGLAPWAPYNPKLRADLGVGGGKNPIVQVQQAGGSTAAKAASTLPEGMFGQFSLPTIAKAIEKANPGADPLVKFAALQELVKIMNPEDRMQTQMMLLQNRQEFQTALEMQREQFRDQEQNQRLEASQQNQGWTIGQVKDAQGNPVPVRINSRTGEVQPVQLPQGTTGLTHIGGANSAGGLPPGWDNSKLDFWANVVKNGGQLPPGIARTAGGSAIVQAIMNRIPGESSGDAGNFIANHATVKADTSSLNNLTKMTDAAESFEKTATKNFDLALSQAKDAVPTDSGPWLNKWVETGETQFGDENVPPYTAALLTAANEYAKIMSGSTGSQGSTVDSRREAAELFSPYLNAGQITRVVAIAKQDMANRKASLYGQVDEVKQRLKTAGSNKPTAEQGEKQPQSAAGGVPVPPDHTSDPDGTQYKGSDGKTYVKQGDKMVPQ